MKTVAVLRAAQKAQALPEGVGVHHGERLASPKEAGLWEVTQLLRESGSSGEHYWD